ncbi:branched-chain amino acid ABC transporter permease [Azospirillum formosense]|nr:branched-chain amino acid ABC transporter permease [Azospirillum formosense]MBY3756462.1 branched-chain amino acid ABC transporter permease [Azospirillum formosense]
MRVVNFTHGELYTFGAYMAYMLAGMMGLNFFMSLAMAALLGMALGALIEFTLLRPLKGADIDTTMLVMIGAGIAMQAGEQLVWGGVAKSVPSPFPTEPVVIGSVSVGMNRLFVLGVALLLLGGFYLLINRTKLGVAMRATFQDPDTAALMGVNRGLMYTLTFALGSGLAATAGALLGPIFVVTPTMGDLVALKAFAIVILGGLGNIPGATIGGFVLALAEEFGAGYLSSGYRDAMGFILIIAVLIVRPQGLFAMKERIG